MPSRPAPRPLDAAALDRLALRYVERFATTRAKLAAYLARKVRERGWDGGAPADPCAVAARMAALGYVDDAAFAEARVRALHRRGFGARRVRDALRVAGIAGEAAVAAMGEADEEHAEAAALAFARRRRFGPWAVAPADERSRARQVAAMVRAGHDPRRARRIVALPPASAVAGLP